MSENTSVNTKVEHSFNTSVFKKARFCNYRYKRQENCSCKLYLDILVLNLLFCDFCKPFFNALTLFSCKSNSAEFIQAGMSQCKTPWKQTLWLTKAMICNVNSVTLAWRRQSHFLEGLFCGGHPIQKEWSQPHKKPSSTRQHTCVNLYLILSSGRDGKTFRRPPTGAVVHIPTLIKTSPLHMWSFPLKNQTKQKYTADIPLLLQFLS